jgi:hypothetical protein
MQNDKGQLLVTPIRHFNCGEFRKLNGTLFICVEEHSGPQHTIHYMRNLQEHLEILRKENNE